MTHPMILLVGLVLGAVPSPAVQAAENVHHELSISVDPSGRSISVEDVVTLSDHLLAGGPQSVEFKLHAGLSPTSATPGVRVLPKRLPWLMRLFRGGAGDPSGTHPVKPEVYRVVLPPGTRTVALSYGGEVHHPLSREENYARGFRQTPGTVSEEGVFLSGATLWYPRFGNDMVTFGLEVELPAGWDAVSQGGRTFHERDETRTRVRWESPGPQDEIYLLAGRYAGSVKSGRPAEIQVFLRSPDEALAAKYLEVGGQYLRMYSDLLGPYPYPKFALVENFWETGYGMPSFSLLGPRVIRFPFILHSSYPHEILHNWWGNGVYMDWERGNWCEGLTAYLADHLIQEGRGSGAEYRQTTLQKYADYVSKGRDFPLVEFRARHSSATEAVGYGKSLMFYHMLRSRLGDEAFVDGLRSFYRDHLFRAASFEDLRRSFEGATGEDLEAEFDQWVGRPGAPRLTVRQASARFQEGEWALSVRIEQTQPEDPFALRIPVTVTLEGHKEALGTVAEMNGRSLDLALRLPARPVRVDVDPEFDVFRRLDPAEIPPALSGAFGAEKVLVVLPGQAPGEQLEAYLQLARGWAGSQPGQWEIRLDSEVGSLPEDRAVWLFGWENRFRGEIGDAAAPYDAEIRDDGVRLGRAEISRAGHSVVIAARHASREDLTLTWLAADEGAALPGLGRKLPHYHKYSYLGFEGPEPENVLKGRWPVVDSPLTAYLSEGARGTQAGLLPPRQPLAKLPPVFSGERMGQTVEWLSSPELEGRGFGSEGLDRAAESIAGAFREAGLEPGGDDGTYFERWTARGGDPEREAVLKNVVGFIPGSRPEWEGQSVVVGAHYDGLGRGWPQDRVQHAGEIHPGADDNASGVAVLLELARVLATELRPERSVVFAAFSGEEAGRLGSQHYVKSPTRFPPERAIGMVNLDTVGRLGKGKLLILGTGTAREWVHIFRGASFVTGVPLEPVAQDVGGSDQVSFVEAGVPAVELFTGPHLDYHRPTDTADKVDRDGLVKVASVVKEAVEYLAGRPEPMSSLSSRQAAGGPSPSRSAGRGKRVSLGTVPDYEYQERGVRLSGVVPDSPAERAGLREGDVVVEVGAQEVRDLAALARVLKALQPGDRVMVTFVRDGVEQIAEAVVEER